LKCYLLQKQTQKVKARMNNDTIDQCLSHFEKILRHVLNNTPIPAQRIKDAMMYSLFPGGKRLRPLLVYLCGQLIDVPPRTLDMIAVSIELIHCYSLVHDDLPAMDNDDFRRGKPSCHRAFDEATAILVGDSMQALAIDILLNELPLSLSMPQVVQVTKELVNACGASGMISGQSLDLSELSKPSLQEQQLRDIHQLKTGQLILACVNMVLAAGKSTTEVADALRKYATHLGLVFQMQDDYLDRYADSEQFGKNRASDAANQKNTFATLYDQKTLLRLINDYYIQAHEALALFGEKAHNLHALTHQLHQRSL